MLRKAFSRLSEAERIRKLDVVIRQSTKNVLNAEQIQQLVKGIRLTRQYIILVHTTDREYCEALVSKNVLHIYIPNEKINQERE